MRGQGACLHCSKIELLTLLKTYGSLCLEQLIGNRRSCLKINNKQAYGTAHVLSLNNYKHMEQEGYRSTSPPPLPAVNAQENTNPYRFRVLEIISN